MQLNSRHGIDALWTLPHDDSSAHAGVDSSEAALELARANAALNGVDGVCRFQRADVAAFMRQV